MFENQKKKKSAQLSDRNLTSVKKEKKKQRKTGREKDKKRRHERERDKLFYKTEKIKEKRGKGRDKGRDGREGSETVQWLSTTSPNRFPQAHL